MSLHLSFFSVLFREHHRRQDILQPLLFADNQLERSSSVEHEFALFSNINIGEPGTHEQVQLNYALEDAKSGDPQQLGVLLTPTSNVSYSELVAPFQLAQTQIATDLGSLAVQSQKGDEKAKKDNITFCTKCDQGFQSISGLYNHSKAHEGKEYPCPEPDCNKKYKTEHLLRRHLKRGLRTEHIEKLLSSHVDAIPV